MLMICVAMVIPPPVQQSCVQEKKTVPNRLGSETVVVGVWARLRRCWECLWSFRVARKRPSGEQEGVWG